MPPVGGGRRDRASRTGCAAAGHRRTRPDGSRPARFGVAWRALTPGFRRWVSAIERGGRDLALDSFGDDDTAECRCTRRIRASDLGRRPQDGGREDGIREVMHRASDTVPYLERSVDLVDL